MGLSEAPIARPYRTNVHWYPKLNRRFNLLIRRACHNTLLLVRLYIIHLFCSISVRFKNSIEYHHCHIDTEDRCPGKVELFLANLTVNMGEQQVNT
jgi:hypothetical protein